MTPDVSAAPRAGRSWVVTLSLAISVLLLPACRVNLIPVSYDVPLGAQTAQQLEAQLPILDSSAGNQAAYQSVRDIVNRVLLSGQVQHREQFVWRLRLVDDDKTLNALCLPGGYIYVFTGLIKYLDSEDQLAGVLAHEIAHASMRHSTRQLTQRLGTSLILYVATGGWAGSEMASQLLSLNFSRSDEREADLMAVRYLNYTEYDPRGVSRFFEKLVLEGKGRTGPSFLSTHPAPANRVKAIEAEWRRLGARQGQTFPDRYARLKASL